MATSILTVGIVLMLVGGSFVFIGSGGWKLLGSRYEDETIVPARITEIQIAKHGLARVEILPTSSSKVEFRRTVRYLSPLASRPGDTSRVEGDTLFLDQADGISAVDYTVLAPDGVHVSQ